MMAYCKRPISPVSGKTRVFRSSRDKVIAGVCGGLADHFDVSATWMRIGFIFGSLLAFPVPILAYGLCIFLMPSTRSEARRQVRKRRAEMMEPPPIPTFANETDAFDHLGREFDEIEARIRILEDHVTSREYVLKRKFDEL